MGAAAGARAGVFSDEAMVARTERVYDAVLAPPPAHLRASASAAERIRELARQARQVDHHDDRPRRAIVAQTAPSIP